MNVELTLAQLRELTALLKVRYGVDLDGYTEASLRRRFMRFVSMAGLSVYDLKYRLTNDEAFVHQLLESLTVNVTEMFRDPEFYRAIRNHVIPMLADQSDIRIWHAGCSTGEEVFSMAILLHEAGILSRTKLYATDVNPQNLEKAKAGIVSLKKMQQYTTNYLNAGGMGDFSTYYTAGYGNAIIDRELRKNIHFSRHNLLADDMFGEFHLVCCRNVLIYFKRNAQYRVIRMFLQSLNTNGILALGDKEPITDLHLQKEVVPVAAEHKIYQRRENAFLTDTHQ